MGKLFLGVDVGTHETKGVLVDSVSWRPVAETAVTHQMENPCPGFFEMDAEGVWWKDFCTVTKQLIEQTGIDAKQISGIGVDVMGCDCIPVDEECRPLRKAILYGIDARADRQIQELCEKFGETEIVRMFGQWPDSDSITPKILWIRDNEPDIYDRTAKFLTGSSYMTAKLTGAYTIDSYLAKAAFRPLYCADGSWNDKDGNYFCRKDQVARPMGVTDLAGKVTAEAAAQCGLCEGTPVIVGTGDSTAESIAAGLLEPGTLFMQFGSTMFYIFCTEQRMDACVEDQFPGSDPYTIPGSFAVTGGTNCAGAMTKWIRDVFYQEEVRLQNQGGPDAYSVMAREAGKVDAGSNGVIVLPFLYGERSPINDPLAKGVIFGLKGEHGRAQINRAALEGVAYSVGLHLKLFAAHGLVPKELVIAGGGTKNPVWMQIVADVTGQPIRVAEDWQTAAYGSACMAAIGCGFLKDFRQLKKVMPTGRLVRPNPDNHASYMHCQDVYENLYRATAKLMHQL